MSKLTNEQFLKLVTKLNRSAVSKETLAVIKNIQIILQRSRHTYELKVINAIINKYIVVSSLQDLKKLYGTNSIKKPIIMLCSEMKLGLASALSIISSNILNEKYNEEVIDAAWRTVEQDVWAELKNNTAQK